MPDDCPCRPSAHSGPPLAPVYGWFTEGFDTLDLKGGQGSARRVARLTTHFETASKQ